MSVNSVGSTWKKWDLHVHTPESFVHHYPGDKEAAWAAFIADLEALPAEFKVLGINDYVFVDGYARVLEERRRGRLANIDLVLPVVELRVDKFGGVLEKTDEGYAPSAWSRVNLHVIFDEVDPQMIRDQFLSAITPRYTLVAGSSQNQWGGGVITRDSLTDLGRRVIESMPEGLRASAPSPLRAGFNNLNVSVGDVKRALDNPQFRGRSLVAIGKSEWGALRWNDNNVAEKKTVINEADLVFTASANPEDYARARGALKAALVNAKLLDCSDAHALSGSNAKDRVGNCFTWIKADATFQGLVQAIHEFEDRVFVGDIPPKRRKIEQNRTKFIQSVRVSKKPGSALPEPWFEADVPLNPDLVAIIGNKGSGKSALSDIVALVGNTRHHHKFSFLKDTRFRKPKTKFAQHFVGELTWADGSTGERSLDEDPDAPGVERVKYLPQSYVEDLCNELGDGGSATFDAELRKIIYSHVPESDRLGKRSMDELLDFKVAEIETARVATKARISKVNAAILEAEQRSTPEFKRSLEERLAAKQAELAALDAAKPKEVADPNASDDTLAEAKQQALRVDALEGEARKLDSEEAALHERKALATKSQAVAKRVALALGNHRKAHEAFVAQLQELLAELGGGIAAAALADLRIDASPIDAVAAAAAAAIVAIDAALADQGEKGLRARRSALSAAIAEAKGKLGEPQRLFVLFKEDVARWEKARADVVGSPDKAGTIVQLNAEIDSITLLPSALGEARAERAKLAALAHGQIQAMVDEYRRLYLPVQNFVASEEQKEMNLPLNFEVRIEEEGFATQFLRQLNLRTRGSFMGVDDSSALLRGMLQEASFAAAEGAIAFADRVDDMLRFDRRDGQAGRTSRIEDQIASGRGATAQLLLDFLYGFDYLSPQYSLTYDGQDIGQLSPGERGLLLLVFYLLVDEDDIPIVIDQPEENLDNQTIYKVLVKCIKRAKERRQVIMVTHNPNLAVVCDAEQIVYASCDKAESRFSYEAGAIENPQIRERVVQILEGTEPAFKNRQSKYRLS
jgi:predicted ATPase